jgi:hypothetical protein
LTGVGVGVGVGVDPQFAGDTEEDVGVPVAQFHPEPISPIEVSCANASAHVCDESNVGPTTVPGSYPAPTEPQNVYQIPDGSGEPHGPPDPPEPPQLLTLVAMHSP